MKRNVLRRSLGRQSLVYLFLCLTGLAVWFVMTPAPSNVLAQGKPQAETAFVPVAGKQDVYVLREVNGQSLCQEATPTELARLQLQSGRQEQMRVIYGGDENLLRPQQTLPGLRITLRATSQLDGFPEAKAAFIRAAQNWESRILSPITIVIDVDYGPTFFGMEYASSNIIGQASSIRVGGATAYSVFRTALINGASTASEATLYGTLPTNQLPTDQGELRGVFSNIPVLRALGLVPAVASPDTEPEPLNFVPKIGFNSRFPFDFDPSDGILISRVDFDGTATHEIGHVLGFSSAVGDKELDATLDASLTLLDFFRFRPGVTTGTFPTAQRILASGGTQVFFSGGPEQGFSTGRSDSTGGDEEQASHWKDNFFTGTYIGVMDPSAARGEREEITPNDIAAFDAIGYRFRSAQQQIEALPRPLDFGDAALNTNVDRTLTVFNTGGQPLQITNIAINNAQFTLVSPGTSFTIPANAQQDVVLRFRPSANGTQTATLTLTSNDPNRPQLTVALSGFGGVQPLVALTSGVARTATAPSAIGTSCQIDATQYTIQVPAGATQLQITLMGAQDIDLYARFGTRVAGTSPNWIADHISDSPNASETITITPTSTPALRAGTYFIGVTNCDPGTASFTLTATVRAGANPLAAVSAASYRGTELATDSIASIFGQSMATGTAVTGSATLPTSLLGTTVRVRDSAGTERLAPLFFVSAGQINCLIPPGTALGNATINVTSGNGTASTGTINIVALAPGLFSANANGQGVAAADALRVLPGNVQRYEAVARFDAATNRFVSVQVDLGAVTEQVFLILYGTGLRRNGGLGGVSAQIGGTTAQVVYAGTQGSLAGLDQANVLLSRTLIGRGEIDVVLTLDGKTTNTVRVNIR